MEPTITQLRKRIHSIAPDAKVILFGSRARGTHSPYSDIDLAIEGIDNDADWLAICRMADIDDELAVPTLLHIDLVRLETADSALRESILREGKAIHAH